MKTPRSPLIQVVTSRNVDKFWQRVERRRTVLTSRVESQVRRIVRDVATAGDAALLRYTLRFDGVKLKPRAIPVTPAQLRKISKAADPVVLMDFEKALFNITGFHRRQVHESWESENDGILLGQRITPIASVGIYIPGGKAAYPSSVLMAAIPAKVAGVERIVAVTPPAALEGNPMVAAVLSLLGIREVYRVGGAQAIAALAYGTETIPAVDKIVGPGNVFVTAAKRLVFGRVDIDMVAGPTEIFIVADQTASPKYVAADLISQAEHDEAASAVCLTDSLPLATLVQAELERQLRLLPREAIAKKSLKNYGALVIVDSLSEAPAIVNRFAPEHLELLVESPAEFAALVSHAGAIFYGPHTPEAVGDYFAGPNHVLPTCGTARFSSPLGVHDFLKSTSILSYSRRRLRQSRHSIERMANLEGLEGHARSIAVRFEDEPTDETQS